MRAPGTKDQGASGGEGGYPTRAAAADLRWEANVRHHPAELDLKLGEQIFDTRTGRMTSRLRNTTSREAPHYIWYLP